MYRPIKITYKPNNPDVRCQGLTPASEDDCPADCTYVRASNRSDAHCRTTQRRSQTAEILRPEDFEERPGYTGYAQYPKYSRSPRGNLVRKAGLRKVPTSPGRLGREGMAQWFARATTAKPSPRSAARPISPRGMAAESKRGLGTRRTQAAPTTRLPAGLGSIVAPIVALATDIGSRQDKTDLKESKGLEKVGTAVAIIDEKFGELPPDVASDVAQAITESKLPQAAKRTSLQQLESGDLGGALTTVATSISQKRSRPEVTPSTGQELMILGDEEPLSPTGSPPTSLRRLSSRTASGTRRGSRSQV